MFQVVTYIKWPISLPLSKGSILEISHSMAVDSLDED